MSDRELIARMAAVVAGAVHDGSSDNEQIARHSVALARAIVAEVDRTQLIAAPAPYVRPPPTALPGPGEPR